MLAHTDVAEAVIAEAFDHVSVVYCVCQVLCDVRGLLLMLGVVVCQTARIVHMYVQVPSSAGGVSDSGVVALLCRCAVGIHVWTAVGHFGPAVGIAFLCRCAAGVGWVHLLGSQGSKLLGSGT